MISSVIHLNKRKKITRRFTVRWNWYMQLHKLDSHFNQFFPTIITQVLAEVSYIIICISWSFHGCCICCLRQLWKYYKKRNGKKRSQIAWLFLINITASWTKGTEKRPSSTWKFLWMKFAASSPNSARPDYAVLWRLKLATAGDDTAVCSCGTRWWGHPDHCSHTVENLYNLALHKSCGTCHN